METDSNAVLNLSFDFALAIIDYCEQLESHKKYDISRQLLKSGTSIGANMSEAQSPESNYDFIHKLKFADKETRETVYWLKLCQRSDNYPFDEKLLNQVKEIGTNWSQIATGCIL